MLNIKNFLGFLILFTSFILSDAYSHSLSMTSKMMASLEVKNPVRALVKLNQLGVDIAAVSKKEKIIDIIISDHEFTMLLKHGFDPKISSVKGVSSWGLDKEYKNPEEIETILNDLHAKYPALTKLVSVGKSLEGRDIWAMKISDNVNDDESATEPNLLFNGMHHAREVMTPEIVIDIAEFLLTRYGSDVRATEWVNSLEVWVMPMLNVDGNNKMWNDDKWWRKNTRGGFGVDLNRNYPHGWNSCNGSSANRNAQDYRGEAPGSEPETQAMMDFIKEIRPAFDISYHSYSEIVIFPYGCEPLRAETKEIIETIGKDIGKKLDYEAGTAWELLYNADGGDIDWMYHKFGVIPFVIEVNSRSQGFQPSYKRWRDKTVERNRAGWQHLLDRALGSGVHGQLDLGLKDYSHIKVEVLLNGSKLMSYPLHANGVYHLTLDAGTYSLNFVDEKGVSLQKAEVSFEDKLMHLSIEKVQD